MGNCLNRSPSDETLDVIEHVFLEVKQMPSFSFYDQEEAFEKVQQLAHCGQAIYAAAAATAGKSGAGSAAKSAPGPTGAEIDAAGVLQLTGEAKAAWEQAKTELLSQESLDTVLQPGSDGKIAAVPEVMLFIDGEQGSGDLWKSQGKAATEWLIKAIEIAPHNADVANLLLRLLAAKGFTIALEFMGKEKKKTTIFQKSRLMGFAAASATEFVAPNQCPLKAGCSNCLCRVMLC